MRVGIPRHSLFKRCKKDLASSLFYLIVFAILLALLSQCKNAQMPVNAGYDTDIGIPREQIPDSLFNGFNNVDSPINLSPSSYTVRQVPWYFKEGTERYYFNSHLDAIKKILYQKALEGEIATYHSPEFREQWKPEALRDTISQETVIQIRPNPVERPSYVLDSVINFKEEAKNITTFNVAEHWDMETPGLLKPKVKALSPRLVIPKRLKGQVMVYTWMSWKTIQSTLPEEQADWLKRYLLFNLTNAISLKKDEFTVSLSKIPDTVLNATEKEKIRHFEDYYSVRPVEWHLKDQGKYRQLNFHERMRAINKMLYQKALSGEIKAYHTPNFEKRWDTNELRDQVTNKTYSSYRPYPVERPQYTIDTVYVDQLTHDQINQYRVAEKWHKVSGDQLMPSFIGIGPVFEYERAGLVKHNCVWIQWETLKAVLLQKNLKNIRKYLLLTLKSRN